MAGNTHVTRPLGLTGFGAGLSALQWIGLIFAGWIVAVYSVTLPELWSAPYSLVQDDARHHVVWFRQLADPALYPNDPVAAFFLSQSPIAYRALFAPAFWLGIDPVVWHLVVLVPLTCLLTTCSIYRFLTHILPLVEQRGMVTLILCVLIAASAMQGLQRNFAIAIFLFAWAAYLERRLLLTAVIFGIGANLYPVAAVVAGASIFVHHTLPIRPLGISDRRAWITIVVAGLAGITGLIPFLIASAEAGPTILLEEARAMPFLNDGRSSFFKPSLWDQIFCKRTGGSALVPICLRINHQDATALTIAALIAGIVFGWFTYRRFLLGTGAHAHDLAAKAAKIAMAVAIAGIGLYVLAYQFAFQLYLPDRYAFLSVGLIFWLCITFLLCVTLFGIAKLAGSIVRPISHALPLIVIGASFFAFTRIVGDGFVLLRDQEPEISAFLRATPEGSIVAGFDPYLDSLPAYGLRSSYIAMELILPYKTEYFALMRDRTFRLRDAFATQSAKELSDFAERENITYFLLNSKETALSERWERSFPDLVALEATLVPMGVSPGGTECVVSFGRRVNLVDAACLGRGS